MEHYSREADGLCVNLRKPCVQVTAVDTVVVSITTVIIVIIDVVAFFAVLSVGSSVGTVMLLQSLL